MTVTLVGPVLLVFGAVGYNTDPSELAIAPPKALQATATTTPAPGHQAELVETITNISNSSMLFQFSVNQK